jgi:copper homeostasis protein
MKKLEVACFNLESAMIAADSGADRIEFCADYSSGGITPDISEFTEIKKACNVPVYVMIRPRAGDFVYDEVELNQMKEDVERFFEAGADGFVFGALTKERDIDLDACKLLINIAKGKPCTFHRAFDQTKNLFETCETLIEIGFKTILTSGGMKSAEEGIKVIAELHKKFADKINILPGGGIRSENLEFIAQKTACDFFHSSCIKDNQWVADADEIRFLKQKLLKC